MNPHTHRALLIWTRLACECQPNLVVQWRAMPWLECLEVKLSLKNRPVNTVTMHLDYQEMPTEALSLLNYNLADILGFDITRRVLAEIELREQERARGKVLRESWKGPPSVEGGA